MKPYNHSKCFLAFLLVLLLTLVGCDNAEDSEEEPAQEDHAEHDHDPVSDAVNGNEDGETVYTCPMHPEVEKDEPGSCPECGMDLVEADSEEMDEHDHDHDHDHEHDQGAEGDGNETVYTCPMHPDVEQDEPGSCPICGMDLVEADSDEMDEHDHEHEHDHDEEDMEEPVDVDVPRGVQQAMNLRTTQAERDQLHRHIETFGRVRFDESRLRHYHPRAEGWIEELDVDAEGDRVEEGERLYTLYSPELINAQEEYLRALRRGDESMIAASRERLEALDVQDEAIDRIREQDAVIKFLPWYARADGEVTALGVREGMYVEPGSEILELADLGAIWVQAEIFGAQADWVEPGQHAEVGLAYRPGTKIHGEISHLYPELDEITRTLRARIPLENPDSHFRPGMWTSVTVHAGDSDEEVFIPLEALIRTGRAARVVVREHEEHFRVVPVEPGEVHGEKVAILDGIEEGDEVVTSGHFLIDSEASLRGGHSRMEGHDH